MFLDSMINRAAVTLQSYEEALKYLTVDRGLTLGEIKKYRLGYTSIPFLPLSDDPEDKEFREETRGLYFLKHKIFLPLENPVGFVNGVITRSIEEDTKYRYKQYHLKEAKAIGAFFGLPQALPHILASGTVYVTEGSFDAISIARHYPNTVSTLTSFVNESQMYLLRLIADTIVLVFDPDQPGRDGAKGIIEKYGSKDIFHREFGQTDANAFMVRHGDAAFKKALGRSLGSLLTF